MIKSEERGIGLDLPDFEEWCRQKRREEKQKEQQEEKQKEQQEEKQKEQQEETTVIIIDIV